MSFVRNIASPLQGSEIMATIRRFPVAAFCMGVLFFLISPFHDFIPLPNFLPFFPHYYGHGSENGIDWRARLIALSECVLIASVAVRLFGERRNWNALREYLVTALITVLLAFVMLTSPLYIQYLILINPLLLMAIIVAPYAFQERDDLSFWVFNRDAWGGLLVAWIGMLLLSGGVSAALFAIKYLFGIGYGDSMEYIWSFGSAVFLPFYYLSCMPRQFRFDDNECEVKGGLSFILNWLLAPLAIVYFLILYAYGFKVLLGSELPKGQLAYMITGFGSTGVMIYLMGWPLRERSTRHLQFLYKHFFKILILPVLLLAYAVGLRISEYGITEERYMIGLATVWFAILCALFAFRQRHLILMPLSLGILLAIAVAGPWGALSVSESSQTTRLETLLRKDGILIDGKIVKPSATPSFEDRQNISSIVSYLIESKHTDRLNKLLGEKVLSTSPADTVEALGFKIVTPYMRKEESQQITINAGDNFEPFDVRGYDYVWLGNAFGNGNDWDKPPYAGRTTVRMKDNILRVDIKDHDPLMFDLAGLRDDNRTFIATNGHLHGKIVVQSASFDPAQDGKPLKLSSLVFRLFYKE